MSKAPLAIVTMVYNETDNLPIWCRHYVAQVGAPSCYVIDHGSDDGSTEKLGTINCIRIPRSPQDDEKRTYAIGQLCASLLAWYDSVIYVDADELLVADPHAYPSLVAFAEANTAPVVTAIGLDVIHRPNHEKALDFSSPVSFQRHHVRFSSAMCKPVLIRQPVTWAPGFHCCAEAPPNLDSPLFLFHTRYADLPSGVARLQRTRNQPWSTPEAGQHQRLANTDWENMLHGMAELPIADTDLTPHDPRLTALRNAFMESTVTRAHERYRLDLHISGHELWRLPERFYGRF